MLIFQLKFQYQVLQQLTSGIQREAVAHNYNVARQKCLRSLLTGTREKEQREDVLFKKLQPISESSVRSRESNNE
uniref:Bm13437 n=1 Tax=Brugia malayi TaxID=6279 RepID=A0A1I9GF26_BRUMA|nr:Bm13437 [Brugia malayi]